MKDIKKEIEYLKIKNDDLEKNLIVQVNEIINFKESRLDQCEYSSEIPIQDEHINRREGYKTSIASTVSYVITKTLLDYLKNKWCKDQI